MSSQRILKFRVWSKQYNCWDNPAILEVWDETGKLEPYSYIKTGRLNPLYNPIESYIIQQFAGLLDKNNKEIYEGDICLIEYYSSAQNEYIKNKDVITFQDGCFVAKYFKLYDKENYGGAYLPGQNKIEIIGNIFENPELLDKE